MRYPEHLIAPMRGELTEIGVLEARTPEEVDRVLAPGSGTVMMIVNSVCGCAAGKARPGIAMALRNGVKPTTTATVFAGADLEATQRVRELLADYPPSSPSVALFQDGRPVFVMHRHQIEGRQAPEIAEFLRSAFEQHCSA
jgi:putative YphP/YqiW family bacilliredoxin